MERDDRGFTLIELMVVVLIIAILLAIAIPTFLGARERANDRAAQSRVRNAHTVQMVVYADGQQFTDDASKLRQVDPSLDYITDPTQLVPGENEVAVIVNNPRVVVGSKSGTGKCFWIRTVGDTNVPRFAANDCTAPSDSDFGETWSS